MTGDDGITFEKFSASVPGGAEPIQVLESQWTTPEEFNRRREETRTRKSSLPRTDATTKPANAIDGHSNAKSLDETAAVLTAEVGMNPQTAQPPSGHAETGNDEVQAEPPAVSPGRVLDSSNEWRREPAADQEQCTAVHGEKLKLQEAKSGGKLTSSPAKDPRKRELKDEVDAKEVKEVAYTGRRRQSVRLDGSRRRPKANEGTIELIQLKLVAVIPTCETFVQRLEENRGRIAQACLSLQHPKASSETAVAQGESTLTQSMETERELVEQWEQFKASVTLSPDELAAWAAYLQRESKSGLFESEETRRRCIRRVDTLLSAREFDTRDLYQKSVEASAKAKLASKEDLAAQKVKVAEDIERLESELSSLPMTPGPSSQRGSVPRGQSGSIRRHDNSVGGSEHSTTPMQLSVNGTSTRLPGCETRSPRSVVLPEAQSDSHRELVRNEKQRSLKQQLVQLLARQERLERETEPTLTSEEEIACRGMEAMRKERQKRRDANKERVTAMLRAKRQYSHTANDHRERQMVKAKLLFEGQSSLHARCCAHVLQVELKALLRGMDEIGFNQRWYRGVEDGEEQLQLLEWKMQLEMQRQEVERLQVVVKEAREQDFALAELEESERIVCRTMAAEARQRSQEDPTSTAFLETVADLHNLQFLSQSSRHPSLHPIATFPDDDAANDLDHPFHAQSLRKKSSIRAQHLSSSMRRSPWVPPRLDTEGLEDAAWVAALKHAIVSAFEADADVAVPPRDKPEGLEASFRPRRLYYFMDERREDESDKTFSLLQCVEAVVKSTDNRIRLFSLLCLSACVVCAHVAPQPKPRRKSRVGDIVPVPAPSGTPKAPSLPTAEPPPSVGTAGDAAPAPGGTVLPPLKTAKRQAAPPPPPSPAPARDASKQPPQPSNLGVLEAEPTPLSSNTWFQPAKQATTARSRTPSPVPTVSTHAADHLKKIAIKEKQLYRRQRELVSYLQQAQKSH
ncbi:hypothetical protein DIPPA_34991 [Diplonema papillatum]|nr:hypothetical protein DIPPA_34991 [Diplonema papillatum]|eukprot:gene16855-25841_t